MLNLPAGWADSALGEIALIDMGQSPEGSATNDQKVGLPLLGGASDLGEFTPKPTRFTSSPTKICQSGDLIYCIRATIGKLNIADQEYCLGRGVAGFRSRGIDPGFLRWLLIGHKSSIAALGTGTTFLQVSKDDLTSFPISVPPLNEQRRIVAKLDALFEKSRSIREKLDRLPRLLANLQKSILNSAFRGDLTKEWRANNPNVEPASELLKRIRAERRAKWEADLVAKGKDPKKAKYVEPEPVDAGGLPELPEGWCWASVESISTKVVDGVHKKPNYVSEGVPFLTVKDLTAGPGISFNNCRYVSQADHQEFIKRTNPEKGDILITKDGTLGVTRAIRTDVEFSIFVSLALVKPVLLEMSGYLEFAFSSPILQAQMTGTGSGLQHIHLTDLRKDLVPLPPLEEQRELVRVLSVLLNGVETLAGQIRNANARVSSIDSSLLSKAFRGELVPQEPSDEPASVLLERIRAQKPAAGTKHGRGRKPATQVEEPVSA